jgi:hypothetical protein
MSAPTLQRAYLEATANNGLIFLVKKLRNEGTGNLRKDEIRRIFESLSRQFGLWENVATGSGHTKYRHGLTGAVIGWQAHGPTNLPQAQAKEILEVVQDHLNLLHNDIFQYTSKGWRGEPNYIASEPRFRQWRQL